MSRKLTKADIDKVRHIEGFPNATDEDIIALSDAPLYTACPNPFIEDFIREHGTPYDEATDDYKCEPFAADVSEGKNDPIYMAHGYHTKVPYKAIMRYILHYTKPDDIVFDGFCGTGMTGMAAQICAKPDADFKHIIEHEMGNVEWGARKAILSDLSPAATFIAYNYNNPARWEDFRSEADRILSDCEREYGWMYETRHTASGMGQTRIDALPIMGRINYTIWSDVLICPTCSKDIVFWDVAVDRDGGEIKEKFFCPHCGKELVKRDCSRAQKTFYDKRLGQTVSMAKQVPVSIEYSVGSKRYKKKPDDHDLALIERISAMDISDWYPTNTMPKGIESSRNIVHGINSVHQFMSDRALATFAKFFSYEISDAFRFVLTSVMMNCTKTYRFRLNGKGGAVSGTLYVPSLVQENNPFNSLKRKAGELHRYSLPQTAITSCNSLTQTTIPSDSIDYIFTDPPFGGNLNYSELSFVWESWLKVITNQKLEAVMNTVQGKGLTEYQGLMTRCFEEYFRVLKPGRWMTVEFHNSQNSVWNAIQESLLRAGFIIADVRTLDKQQASFKQVTTTSAVKQDLVISAYKPKDSFKRDFIAKAGSVDTAWSFVAQHLERLPVTVVKNNKIELIAERQAFLLFDRMIAYHIMNGISVPLDSGEFYKGLDERFMKRDGMYFLADQVNEYDTVRITNEVESIQFELFVSNERSAVAWLYQQLTKPQTYAEIQPQFMQQLKAVDKYEAMPELAVLLEDNFLQDEKGKWYIPDVRKTADVQKLREKKLYKEFEVYIASKGKLKLFRLEAIRIGFARLWEQKNYKLIIETAERLPESTIQEDDKLLMYYDISLGRIK